MGNNQGISIVEMAVVVIIAGVIMITGFMSYQRNRMIAESKEGLRVLSSIVQDIKIYKMRNKGWPSDVDDLAREISDLKYFGRPEFNYDTEEFPTVTISHNTQGYTLYADESMHFSCSSGSNEHGVIGLGYTGSGVCGVIGVDLADPEERRPGGI